jgi:sugar (pentulose or hexulose) kinase
VLGGGQRNNLWLQIKADVTGRPVEVLQHPEVTLMGAALLAGVGAGVYRDAGEAVASIEIPVARLEPDRGAHQSYEDAFGRFLELAPALRSFHSRVHG